MSTPGRIGILTGGGDVPGLNAVIKSVVHRSVEMGAEVVGIRRGWQGLTRLRNGTLDPEFVRPLDRVATRAIDRTGGTILHTSRTNPRRMRQVELPAWLSSEQAAQFAVDDGPLRPDAHRPAQHRSPRHRSPRHDRRRRHAQLLANARRCRRPTHRDPEDHG